jgi:aldehyde:ferredoxin oxidoreductase
MIPVTMGKILWVDLASGAIWDEQLPDEIYERYLGGIGLAAYILYREIPAHADPLGPENVIGFVPGLLTGSGSLFTGRWMAAARSPLTGTWGEANCGGTLSNMLKRSGYDGIFFKGISPRPVYLYVENGRARLLDAGALWGKDTSETDDLLRKEHTPASAVACIGPAGERLSLISGICNDRGRLAARSGLGAVMGSKRLKALVVRGNGRIAPHDPAEMKRLTQRLNRYIRFRPPFLAGAHMKYVGALLRVAPLGMAQDGMLYKLILQKWGTVGMNQASIEMGDGPVKNWRGDSTTFTGKRSEPFSPEHIALREVRKYRCSACSLGCGGLVDDPERQESAHKPEYESVTALGALLLINDLEAIFKANEILNRAGMDSISAGGTLAFAFECYERGLITKEDTGGLELKWGDSAAMLALLELIISRQGVGDLLADGAKIAAQRIGAGAEEFAVQAGGQELAMHDPRNDPGFALHAVVEAAPGRHTTGSWLYYEMFKLWTRLPELETVAPLYPKGSKYQDPAQKAAWAAACTRFGGLTNAAGLCLFGLFFGVNRIPVFEWLNAATGWQRTPQEYMQIGERIAALKQRFNAREGIPLRHTISRRALGLPPQEKGANKGRSVDLDALVREYWKAMGWDAETGMPGVEEEIYRDPGTSTQGRCERG